MCKSFVADTLAAMSWLETNPTSLTIIKDTNIDVNRSEDQI